MTSPTGNSDALLEQRIRKLISQARESRTFVPRPPRRLYVWAPIANQLRVAAQLEWKEEVGRFSYVAGWIDANGAYPLDPLNLPLDPTPVDVYENRGIPGVVADAGPDGWGQGMLIRASPTSSWNAFDSVLDTSGRGAGALRATLTEDADPDISSPGGDDPLDRIENACQSIMLGEPVDPSLNALVFQRCCGMGGARPKAAIVVDGREVLAKFKNPRWDIWDVQRVEAACLVTARYAGIEAAKGSLVTVNHRSVLLVDRFDRHEGQSIHYLSARSLLNAFGDGETETLPPKGRATYAAIVAAARRIGVDNAGEDMFRRMCFNYAIGNTDDHLRNHGFLLDGTWRLAPAFDLVSLGEPAHAIGIGQEGLRRSRTNLLSRLDDFGLDIGYALDILTQAIDAARRMGEELDRLGMPSKQRDQILHRLCSEAKN
jgi:serine/threonine-protein kinase HipA